MREKDRLSLKTKTISVFFFAAFAAFYAECYREGVLHYLTGEYIGFMKGIFDSSTAWHFALFFLIFLPFFILIIHFLKPILHFLDRHRYAVALLIFLICIAFSISGSSIACWYGYLHGIKTKEELQAAGVLLGIPRVMRADEYGIFTPFNISQQFNSYSAVSGIIRGDATDVTTLYGQPAWALVTLFRPFYLGYLLFGSAKGLSFYWIGRLLALFLVSYECAKIYSGNDKCLSALAASVLTFSPIIQWWFSTNGIAELLIFGQGALIILCEYTKPRKLLARLCLSLLLVECMGGYLFVYYPAWQIPLGYLFLLLGLWILISRRKEFHYQIKRELFMLFFTLAILTLIVIGIWLFSKDTLLSIMNTAFPGKRIQTGGGGRLKVLCSDFLDIFYPFDSRMANGNANSYALIFSLFPVGTITGIYCLIKKRDRLFFSLLLSLQAVFLCYYFFGLPEFLARITLLSKSRIGMMLLPVGTTDLFLLIHGLSCLQDDKSGQIDSSPAVFSRAGIFVRIAGALSCSALALYFCYKLADYKSICYDIFILFVSFPIFLAFFFIKKRYVKNLFCLLLSFIVIMTGLSVNPVQKGVDCITESKVIQSIQRINAADPGSWAVTDEAYPMNNLCVMAGVPTVSSSQVYPDISKWSKLDPTGIYTNTYNRYCHVQIDLVSTPTVFENPYDDQLLIHLNYEDIKTLGIKYIVSMADYTKTDRLKDMLRPVGEYDDQYIYKVEENK